MLRPGLPDIAWFDPDGAALTPQRWHDRTARAFAMQLAGRNGSGGIDILRVLMNPGAETVVFALPEPFAVLLDTAAPDDPPSPPTASVPVAAHALVVVGRKEHAA
jgi:glycogen operon protein